MKNVAFVEAAIIEEEGEEEEDVKEERGRFRPETVCVKAVTVKIARHKTRDNISTNRARRRQPKRKLQTGTSVSSLPPSPLSMAYLSI